MSSPFSRNHDFFPNTFFTPFILLCVLDKKRCLSMLKLTNKTKIRLLFLTIELFSYGFRHFCKSYPSFLIRKKDGEGCLFLCEKMPNGFPWRKMIFRSSLSPLQAKAHTTTSTEKNPFVSLSALLMTCSANKILARSFAEKNHS